MKIPSSVVAAGVIVGVLGVTDVALRALPKPGLGTPATQLEVKAEKEIDIDRWILPNGSHTENLILEAMQERGITDQYALAVILGNIKQESNFHSNICEGGYRVNYSNCNWGGYGLIQWTCDSRYYGLGRHADRLGLDPTSAEAQVSYIFEEQQWKDIEHHMKTPEKSLAFYMNRAYNWLGWGIHGNRTYYAQQYLSLLERSK